MRSLRRGSTSISPSRRSRSSLRMDCTHRIKDINFSFMRTLLFVCLVCLGFAGSGQSSAPEVATPQWRPVYHFTPETNWTNDPNGPIWLKGEYLLYNQQNPFENKWGHMSWGHAVSRDLIHWKHLPVAI